MQENGYTVSSAQIQEYDSTQLDSASQNRCTKQSESNPKF